MKTLLLFTLSILPLAAQVPHVQVRVVSIEKAANATSLEAAQPDCDERLYAALIADVTAGKARIVQDQTLVVRSGQRAKTEAIREFPTATSHDIEPEEWVRYPDDFMSYILGSTVEVEATASDEPGPGQIGRMLDLNVAPEHSTLLAMHPWPVPDLRGAGQMGRVLQPVIATHRSSTQVLSWTGRTVLLTVAANPGAAFQESAEIPFRYTFMRSGIDGETPARPNARTEPQPVQQHRLHAINFRMPRDEAARLLLQHQGDDAALFGSLSEAVNNGTVKLSAHTAIMVRSSQRSKVESYAQFHIPQSGEVIPKEWYDFHPGWDFEAEETHEAWQWALQSREAPELVPFHPDAARPSLYAAVAEYTERKWAQQARIPESGVLCSGVLSTSPATEESDAPGGLTDVSFLLQSPRPAPTESAQSPQVMLQGLIISVPAAEGPALANTNTKLSAEALLDRLHSGELTCTAHVAATIAHGQRPQMSFTRRIQQPGGPKPPPAGPGPHSLVERTARDCGLSMEAELGSGTNDLVVNIDLVWDTAPVLPFGEPGAIIPEIAERRCVQKITLRDLHLTRGKPIIADVRASNARPGTPEHDRWHVLVMQAR